MSDVQEYVQPFPAHLVKNFKGLSLDIGGSLWKFVYRSKKDKEVNGDKVDRLHLVSFPRTMMNDAFEFVRSRADVTRTDGEQTTICTTGIGCLEFNKLITEAFDVKLRIVNEMESVPKAFFYLASHLRRADLFEPYERQSIDEPIAEVRGLVAALRASKAAGDTATFVSDMGLFDGAARVAMARPRAVESSDLPLVQAEPDSLPCLLVMCGSAHCFFAVQPSGKHWIADGIFRGGKSMFGIGSLLTGYKSFAELVDAAATGDRRKVDQFSESVPIPPEMSDGSQNGSKTEFYTEMLATSFPMYTFGHAVGADRDALKREDIARAWLHYSISDLVQCTLYVCEKNGYKRVAFSGGILNYRLVRQIITTEFVFRLLCEMFQGKIKDYIEFDFVRPGPHLGALGCVINDTEHFL